MSSETLPLGRVIAIGDIHGCSRALDGLLTLINPQPEDLVITLGDHVDRGPDTAGVLDRLIELRNRCRLVSLKGNHEEMMLRARQGQEVRSWMQCGGREALASYPRGRAGLDEAQIPPTHWEFLDHFCRDWYETSTHFFVHANVYPDTPLPDQPTFMLRWESIHEGQPPHCSGKVMICGHTSQRSGLPLSLGHAVCIDTWVYGKGWLTGLDTATGRFWQANQLGQTRTGWLDSAESLPPCS